MTAKSKIEVPLFEEKRQRGRPIKYDFSPFKKESTKYLVIPNVGLEEYDSLRSTFARWRRIEGIEGRFNYDFLKTDIAIWRA
jgi:hypothetical protein